MRRIILDGQELLQNLSPGIGRHLHYELVKGKAFVCIGVRRCGKSTLLHQIIKALIDAKTPLEDIVYINFFDDRLSQLNKDKLHLITDLYFSLFPNGRHKKKVYFFFDELQEITGWESFVDRLMRTENCEVFITGSSAAMLSKEISSRMRGRSLAWEIFPFSFSEFLDWKKISTASLSSKTLAEIGHALQEYYQCGGFPETIDTSLRTRTIIHQDYFRSIVGRDVIERYDVSHPQAVHALAIKLLDTIGGHYSVNRLFGYLKESGFQVSKNFVNDCLGWFEDAFFLFPVRRYSLSLKQQAVNTKKIYCVDHALARSVVGESNPFSSWELENLVFMHLRQKHGDSLFYYRNNSGTEVDFAFKEGKAFRLIQVSHSLSNPNTRDREMRALTAAMLETKTKSAVIVTREEEEILETDAGKIMVIPLWKFLLDLY